MGVRVNAANFSWVNRGKFFLDQSIGIDEIQSIGIDKIIIGIDENNTIDRY